MITITLQAPREVWLIIIRFITAMHASRVSSAMLASGNLEVQRALNVEAGHWKLLLDDIIRNLGEDL